MPSAKVRALSVDTAAPPRPTVSPSAALSDTTPITSVGQPKRVARSDGAADARAAADRHIDRVEIRARRRAIPRHRSPRRAPVRGGRAAPGNRPSASAARIGFFARRVEIVAKLEQFGAEGAHRGVLLRPNCPAARRPPRAGRRRWRRGPGLAVIAARRGDDAGRVGMGAAQPVDEGDAAAHLERARRPVVFLLSPNLAAEPGGQLRPGILRGRAMWRWTRAVASCRSARVGIAVSFKACAEAEGRLLDAAPSRSSRTDIPASSDNAENSGSCPAGACDIAQG